MQRTTLAKSILVTGWVGVAVTATGIALKNTDVFIYSQVIGALSGLLYDRFLVHKFSFSSLFAFSLTILAGIHSSEWLLYSSMLARSINYQLVFLSFCQKEGIFFSK